VRERFIRCPYPLVQREVCWINFRERKHRGGLRRKSNRKPVGRRWDVVREGGGNAVARPSNDWDEISGAGHVWVL